MTIIALKNALINFIFYIVFLAVVLINNVYAQKNTEKFREFKNDGFYHTFNFGVHLNKGNEEYIKFLSDYRLDLYQPDFITFLVGNIEYQEGNMKVISNRGFLHGRFIYNRDKAIEPEIFLQMEYNDFLKLKERYLAGGGVRLSVLNSMSKDSADKLLLEFGTGLMYEYENVNDSIKPKTKYIRSANYITFRYELEKRINFYSVGYFQPYLGNLKDFRILSENRLAYSINKNFSVFISAIYRYDNEPHTNLKNYDIEIINGITFSF